MLTKGEWDGILFKHPRDTGAAGPWKLNNEEIGPERFIWERRPVGRLGVLEQKEKERIEYVSMRFVEELESSK